MSVRIAQICDGIADTLAGATGLGSDHVQSYNELTEGINDWPMLQVWPSGAVQDPTTETERTTFAAGVRQTDLTVYGDLFARPRSMLGEDMAKVVDLVEAIQTIIENQDTKPYFGVSGIKAFNWSWQYSNWEFGGTKFDGARFTFTIRIF